MSPIMKSKKSNSSMGFTIGVSVAVVLMLALVGVTIAGSKKDNADNAKIQSSASVSISAATVGDKTGEESLAPFDESAQSGVDPAVGQIVPKFTAQKFDETRLTIEPNGKPYALIFLAHWCPNCQAEVPIMVGLDNNGQVPENVEIYGITTGTSKDRPNYPPSRWLLREDWPWVTVADTANNQIASAFGLPGYPYMVFVNADGTVSRRTSGQVPESQLVSYLNAIAASEK